MKINLTTAILLLLIPTYACLASPPFEFGKIAAADMDLEYYREKYPDEPAVIIGDVADCRFTYNNSSRSFQFVFNRERRLIILNEAGLRFGDFSIPFYQSDNGKEKLTKFRAHVYNLKGTKPKRTRIKVKEGFVKDLDNNWKEYAFAFPEVKPGSVVEVKYSLASDFLFNMRGWRFQHHVPVIHSEYNVNLPSFFNYRARNRGFFELAVNEKKETNENFRYTEKIKNYGQNIDGDTYTISSKSTHYKWVVKNMEGLKEEPYTDNIYNYLGGVSFEMLNEQFPDIEPVHYTTTWEDVSKYLLKHKNFGKYLDEAQKIITYKPEQEFDSPEETIQWAMETIHEKVKWNQDASFMADNTAEEVVLKGVGNSAEINLLLVALLRHLNFPAYPVAISTVENGALVSDSPTISEWDYVAAIVKLPGHDPVMADATLLKPIAGYLPQRAINGQGRIIDNQVNEWVNLEQHITSDVSKFYDLSLDQNGNLRGHMTFNYTHFGAFKLLQQIENSSPEDLLKSFSGKTGVAVSNISLETEDKEKLMVTLKADVNLPGYAQNIGNEMLLPALLFETIDENPFKSEERVYPVKYPTTGTTSVVFNINLPDNMTVTHLPGVKEKTWGRFSYICNFIENQNSIIITYAENRKTRTVKASQYEYFRNFMTQKVNDNNDNIILQIE